jgi:hypothetical protein
VEEEVPIKMHGDQVVPVEDIMVVVVALQPWIIHPDILALVAEDPPTWAAYPIQLLLQAFMPEMEWSSFNIQVFV